MTGPSGLYQFGGHIKLWLETRADWIMKLRRSVTAILFGIVYCVVVQTCLSFGRRPRERCMMSNWCLRASDSAATARTPPGRPSRTSIANKWVTKTKSNLIGRQI